MFVNLSCNFLKLFTGFLVFVFPPLELTSAIIKAWKPRKQTRRVSWRVGAREEGRERRRRAGSEESVSFSSVCSGVLWHQAEGSKWA